jgi:hypothetical protein
MLNAVIVVFPNAFDLISSTYRFHSFEKFSNKTVDVQTSESSLTHSLQC